MNGKEHKHEAIDRWMTYLERQGKSPLTREAYLNALTHFMNWLQQTYSDEFDPQEVIARDIREWKSYQQTVEKASPNTINQRLVAIGRFFSWAHGENIVQMNPAADVDLINVSELKPKGLDSRSLRQLLRAVHKYGSLRDIAIVELLAGTGLRVSELLRLSIGDVQIGERPPESHPQSQSRTSPDIDVTMHSWQEALCHAWVSLPSLPSCSQFLLLPSNWL